jgi:hypothetical protein
VRVVVQEVIEEKGGVTGESWCTKPTMDIDGGSDLEKVCSVFQLFP